jgi:hypothetical protein
MAMSLPSSVLVLAAMAFGQAPANEFNHSFRDKAMPPPEKMELYGMDANVEITPEPEGLRIHILGNRLRDGVGLRTSFPVTGDFEVTATFEILSAEKPTTGYGVGINLALSPSDYKKTAALSRHWTVNNRSGFQARMNGAGVEGRSEWEPSETMKGQLRMRREGTMMSFLFNEEPGQPFRELLQAEYGKDNIDAFRLVVNSGKSPAAVDVRILDVHLHWGGLPAHALTAPAPAVGNVGPVVVGEPIVPAKLGQRWPMMLGLLFLLSVGLLMFYLVHSRKRKAPADPPL